MKKIVFVAVMAMSFIALQSTTSNEVEPGKKVPSVSLKDMDGNSINTAEVFNDGNPIVISFWATWCKPCRLELSTIAEEYDDWQEETGVKLVAVSVDDQRNLDQVKPVVNSSGWDYDVWLDPNGDFKRAMGVNNVPHTFLIDGKGNIVYAHNNYVLGDEEELYEEILKISQK